MKEAGYSGGQLEVAHSSFIFTYRYNEKLLEILRRGYMIQGIGERTLWGGQLFPHPTGDQMEENGHLGS